MWPTAALACRHSISVSLTACFRLHSSRPRISVAADSIWPAGDPGLPVGLFDGLNCCEVHSERRSTEPYSFVI